MTSPNSYRAILRSSATMGAASVVNILSGLIKTKSVALILGPTGVGLYGLYLNLVSTAATISALGLGTVGTRQVAAAQTNGSESDIAATRRALFWGTSILAVVGGMIFFLLRGQIAAEIIADPLSSSDVGWLALGLTLTVLAGSQTALLTGLRRVGDLARIQVASGIVSMIFGIGALLLWRSDGIIVLVLIGPITVFLLGHWYVYKLNRPINSNTSLRMLFAHCRSLVRLGIPFMLATLVTGLGHLTIRILVQRDLGSSELGQFQAAWTISMTYLTFLLNAMATDYYPRLSGDIHDPRRACQMVNEQTEIALLIVSPILLLMLGLAPWIIKLLYTPEFSPAIDILRWQLLGDIFKVLSFPLGFVLLATGAGKTYILTETSAIVVFVLGVTFGLPLLGVETTGVAFLAMYLVYLPIVFLFARKSIRFSWSTTVKIQAAALIVAGSIVAGLGHISNDASAIAGIVLAIKMATYMLIRFSKLAKVGGLQSGLISRILAKLRFVIR